MPLSDEEQAVWRQIARLLIAVPRVIGAEMAKADGLVPSEYAVLVNLSEQPGRSMRMSELAQLGTLSGSGMSRVVERMAGDGLVERVKDSKDGRGQLAVLTDKGLARLKEAYPRHLVAVRRHVMDHLAGLDLPALAAALAQVATDDPLEPPRPAASGEYVTASLPSP
jgi:DNA-binding MarR family transcriptional regulator